MGSGVSAAAVPPAAAHDSVTSHRHVRGGRGGALVFGIARSPQRRTAAASHARQDVQHGEKLSDDDGLGRGGRGQGSFVGRICPRILPSHFTCGKRVSDRTQRRPANAPRDADGEDGEQEERQDVVAPLHSTNAPPTQDLDGSQLRARLGTNMTPVREHHFANRIEDTPLGADRDVYKYYCPLCMFYLRSVLVSSCCGHYSCMSCAVQYLRARALLPTSQVSVPDGGHYEAPCPHCTTAPLVLTYAAADEAVRDYGESPSKRAHPAASCESFPKQQASMAAPTPRCSGDRQGADSPARTGARTSPVRDVSTLADVQRKLLTFEDDGENNVDDDNEPQPTAGDGGDHKSGDDNEHQPTTGDDVSVSDTQAGANASLPASDEAAAGAQAQGGPLAETQSRPRERPGGVAHVDESKDAQHNTHGEGSGAGEGGAGSTPVLSSALVRPCPPLSTVVASADTGAALPLGPVPAVREPAALATSESELRARPAWSSPTTDASVLGQPLPTRRLNAGAQARAEADMVVCDHVSVGNSPARSMAPAPSSATRCASHGVGVEFGHAVETHTCTPRDQDPDSGQEDHHADACA